MVGRGLRAFSLGLVVLSALAAARAQAQPSEPSLRVGIVLPLSGPYDAVGEALLAGLRLGFAGSPVQLEVRDSQGQPEQAVQALNELVLEHRPIAVLGGVGAAESTALAVRANELGVSLLSFSKEEKLTQAGAFVFRNMMTLRSQGEAIAHFASCKLGLRSFSVLAPQEPNAATLTGAFIEQVAEQGGQLQGAHSYPTGKTTFTAEARALKPLSASHGLLLPDSWRTVSLIAPALAVQDIITNSCQSDDLRKIRVTLKGKNYQTVTLLGTSGWRSPETSRGRPELLDRGGKFMHCAYFVDGYFAGSPREANQRFVAQFKSAHSKRSPNLLNAYGFDSALLFRHVIEGVGARDVKSFRDALAAVENLEGATGTLRLNEQREVLKPFVYLRLMPSGVQWVEPGPGCEDESLAAKD